MGKKKRKYSEDENSSKESGSDTSSTDNNHEGGSNDQKSKRKSKKKKKSSSSEKKLRKLEEKKLKAELKELRKLNNNFGYDDTDNPFNDTNLSSGFVWKKKVQKEIKRGMTKEEREQRDRQRMVEIQQDLENLKKRRAERELEMKLREEENMRLQRDKEFQSMGDWNAKENEFHLKQAESRAKIRIQEGRAKPIDILAMTVSLASNGEVAKEFDLLGIDVRMDEPYLIFQGLNLEELEELYEDIKMYSQIETDEENKQFWRSMLIVGDDELSKIKNLKLKNMGVSESVLNDIDNLLSKKNYQELETLQTQVEDKLRQGGAIDIEYWEALIKALIVWKAKVKIHDLHEIMLQKRQYSQSDPKIIIKNHKFINAKKVFKPFGEKFTKQDPQKAAREKFAKLIEEDMPTVAPDNITSLNDSIKKEVLDLASEDEEELAEREIKLPEANYHWQDKYRPRKPLFFNRVHTGYEWTKYNKVHYDTDNPPPKVVKGYKFNIFYPDLIDNSKAPTYKIERDGGFPETVIIRFISGPPYEDIAFRIVNREWEYSHKFGFKCVFDRGVLKLYFRFKRQLYRK